MEGGYSSGVTIDEAWPNTRSQDNSALQLNEHQNAMHHSLADTDDKLDFAQAEARQADQDHGKVDRLAGATTDEKLASYASSIEGIGPNSDLYLLSLQSRLLIDTIVESRIKEEVLTADTEMQLPDWLAKANMYLQVLGEPNIMQPKKYIADGVNITYHRRDGL